MEQDGRQDANYVRPPNDLPPYDKDELDQGQASEQVRGRVHQNAFKSAHAVEGVDDAVDRPGADAADPAPHRSGEKLRPVDMSMLSLTEFGFQLAHYVSRLSRLSNICANTPLAPIVARMVIIAN